MSTLTVRQEQVFSFIHTYVEVFGYPPTLREIGDGLGIRSPNGVTTHLTALERKGLIHKGRGSRTIRLVGYGIRLQPC